VTISVEDLARIIKAYTCDRTIVPAHVDVVSGVPSGHVDDPEKKDPSLMPSAAFINQED
jgi:hypothetical protein